ncbi:MAG: S41 family peptidase [Alphaproteobacteria bacterium]
MLSRWKSALLGTSFFFLLPTVALAQNTVEEQQQLDKTYQELALFGQVFNHIRERYVEQVSDEDLIKSAIDGMLRSLDPHSNFLTGEEATDMQEQTTGSYGGLGIQVSQDENGMVLVIAPFDDTPAAKAGILPGDRISHVDGETTMGESLDKATEKMKGEQGTDVTLTIMRDGIEPFDVVVTRDVIRPNPVRWRLEGDNGYIRLAAFNQRTTEVLLEAVTDLKKQAAKKDIDLNGYVLDLRSNPGGLLDQAVSVVDSFVDEGEVVSIRGRDPNEGERFIATDGDILDGKPMIVLINSGSASASEIVAGALQDLDRAMILGERSFGKGSVQTVEQVSADGDLVRMTTARYFTPSGRSIQGDGIHPDIEVKTAKIEVFDRQIIREGDIPGALSNPGTGIPLEDHIKSDEPKDDNIQDTPKVEDNPTTKDDNNNADETSENKKGLIDSVKDALKSSAKKEEEIKGNKVPEEIVKKEIEAAEQDNQLQRALDLLDGIAIYQKFQGQYKLKPQEQEAQTQEDIPENKKAS